MSMMTQSPLRVHHTPIGKQNPEISMQPLGMSIFRDKVDMATPIFHCPAYTARTPLPRLSIDIVTFSIGWVLYETFKDRSHRFLDGEPARSYGELPHLRQVEKPHMGRLMNSIRAPGTPALRRRGLGEIGQMHLAISLDQILHAPPPSTIPASAPASSAAAARHGGNPERRPGCQSGRCRSKIPAPRR